MSPRDALHTMLASHLAATRAVEAGIDQISAAAEMVANTIRTGHRLIYAAAGSSGLMALADASELPGTFGISPDQIRISMAGGVPIDGHMPGHTEDDASEAERVVAEMSPGDTLIAISASGTTPYPCAIAQSAKRNHHKVIAIANAADATLLDYSDIAISVPTAPEVIEGSTRLGSGTAQKVVLNMISTQAGILLRHVHDGLMVNLQADNQKLRNRATRIVRKIAGVSEADALDALSLAQNDTKTAALIAYGASAETATALLLQYRGDLARCLKAIEPTKTLIHSTQNRE